MSQAKIEIEVGKIRFVGEGEQEWLSTQLEKILTEAEKLLALAPRENSNSADSNNKNSGADKSNAASQSLASFLKEKKATSAQVNKFLATAIWVGAKNNKENLKTSDVSSALTKASQSKINNPSDKLNQNVAKGFCEKKGSNEFFVTQEGKDHMGK